MSVKLVVLYTRPADPDAFEEHYRNVHSPLVEAVPGLQRWESGLLATADGGELPYYRITELWFADRAALEQALASAEGRATAADYEHFAPAGSRLFIAPVDGDSPS
jgi:uncharacterized protein (TIGR02118 family)